MYTLYNVQCNTTVPVRDVNARAESKEMTPFQYCSAFIPYANVYVVFTLYSVYIVQRVQSIKGKALTGAVILHQVTS